MATIAQGIAAGNYANGLNALAAFIAALQAAVAANQSLFSIQIMVNGNVGPIVFMPPGGALSVADSKAYFNDQIALANQLTAQWTAALNVL